MIVRRVLIGAIAAALTASGIAMALSAPAAPAPTPSSNKAAAVSDARTLLSKLVLPSGATPVASTPAWDPGGCACPLTPNAIDGPGWWRVPARDGDVIAFVKDHRPAGSTVVSTGIGSGPGFESESVTFGWPGVPGVLWTRWLVVYARALRGGAHGVRADGLSVWLTPRSRSDRVPPARRLRVLVVRGSTILQGPITVRSRAKIHRLIAFLNGLPAPQPGVSACPVDRGVRVILDFYGSPSRRKPSAVAAITVGGCGGTTLTVHGQRELGFGNPPSSAGGRYATTEGAVAAIIGRKLKTG